MLSSCLLEHHSGGEPLKKDESNQWPLPHKFLPIGRGSSPGGLFHRTKTSPDLSFGGKTGGREDYSPT